ncbi:MAG: choice-of-anchor D domain-containing protein [Kofleriaceae bacterium]
MSRKKARLVACTAVGVTALFAALAWGDYTTTSNPADADNVPIGQSARAVVSIRNSGTASRTITGISKTNPIPTTCVSSIVPSTLSGTMFPVTLAPNAQLQILVQGQFTGSELSMGPLGCTFRIDDTSGLPPETFSVTFANTGGSAWELQPRVMNFGTQSGFEVQTALAQNHSTSSATYMQAMIMDPSGTFTFQSPCFGMQSCAGTMISAGSAQQLQIKCDPTMSGTHTATLGLYGGMGYGSGSGSALATMTLMCSGTGSGSGSGSAMIDIVPTLVDVSGPEGTPTMVPVAITYSGSAGSWRMTGANINSDPGNVFSFVGGGCSAHTCAFSPPDLALPTSIDITCTPDSVTHTATLVAQGEGGANDFDMATLRCLSGSGGPSLQATPNPVIAGSYSVGMSSPAQQLVLTNTGSGTLTAQIAPPGGGEWTASNCVASACTLNGAGSSTTVNVVFTPATHGDRSSNFVITNNGTQNPVNVGLVGSGSGATLAVTAPPSPAYTIDFGTIPRGSSPQRPLTMLTTGNIPITVNVNAATSPFSVTSGQFTLSPGIPGGTTVGCSSPVAGGPFTQTISFSSNAYAMDTMSVTARCQIADTDLEVAPTPFDFGEVRVGEPAAELAFTLRNPSSTTPLVIHSMRLSSSSAGLSLDAPINTNTTLAPGEVRSAKLVLDPQTEVDLAGRTLDISVDSSMLSFPITGKVVRARVRVVPEELDLGTACVDSQVIGQVLMINDGTATLTMQRPTMTNSFAAVLQDPTDYPAPLLANRTAMVGVTPSASTSGLLEGSMTWEVDADGSPFDIPIRLEYIADGAAVSPGRLPFGVVPVETRSERKNIKLENCGTAPVTLELGGVSSRTGGTKVWDVQPSRGTIVLPPDGVQMIGVEFSPYRRGSYAATIELEIDGVPHPIEIFGDATGPILEPTSFYACSCSGPSAPSRGWPVLLALIAISRRRRSGSSSAR